MDKETLSNYGWIVICVLVLSVMIALATPFGDYVADGFKAAYKGFGDTNTEVTDMMYSAVGAKAPASCGIEGHYKGDNRGEHGIPATDCTKGHRYTCECVSFVVPEGGIYTMATAVNGKSVYNAGEALPNHYVMKNGDKFESIDYNYIPDYTGGWRVYVKDKVKTEYEAILPEIAGKPITNMRSTFKSCASLIMAPSIPNSVMVLDRTFVDCTSLKTAPKIPDGITDMNLTFQGCSSLTTAPVVPSTVTDMTQTFYGCKSLKTAPSIPNSVTNMGGTFLDCISLTIAPVIPDSVTNMGLTFDGCTSLTKAPTIPNSVKNMNATFSNCTSLTTAPAIPNSVTNMNSTFGECKSLITAPDMSKANSVIDMNHTFFSCTALTTAPTIPNSVTNMTSTFLGCTSITGTIEINANPTEYKYCFDSTRKPIILTGTSTMLSQIAEGRSNITIQQ